VDECQTLSSGAAGIAVGAKTSLADVTIFAFLTEFMDDVAAVKATYEKNPTIKAIVERVAGLEEIKSWIATRTTPF
jgi:tRNA C32,U32 (ribose-2'-O)-methylase TrmJ